MGERAAEDGAPRILGDQVADRGLDLVKGSLEVQERVPLERVCGDRHPRLCALTEREGPGDELLGLAEPARSEREHRPRGADGPELSGLTQLISDANRRGEIGFRLTDVANLKLRGEPVVMPLHEPLGVADPLSHLAKLATERETLRDCVRGEDGGATTSERVRERCRVSRAAG